MKLFRVLTTTGLAVACALASGPALAFPSHERHWEYYADASLSTLVGGREMDCFGDVYVWGQQGPYRVLVYEFPCDPEGPIQP